MKANKTLLLADATINLILGGLLVFFPGWLVTALGIPAAQQAFYPSILGAVLVGIGIALLLERRKGGGLGLGGAIAINMTGGLVLAAWLLFGGLSLPLRGEAFLWGLVIVLVGISSLELGAQMNRRRTGE
jgi:hypothetical protein